MEALKIIDQNIERPPSRYMKQLKQNVTEDQTKMSNTQDSGLYQLQLFNMITSEGAFCTTMQIEIQKILDEIKKLDIDSAIRLNKPSDLSKTYVKDMKKWLFSVQQLNKETIEKKINAQIDVQQVLDSINVKDSNEGVRKLFKILQVLEIMISKITELEAVTFLKYDNYVQSIKEESKQCLKSKISQLSQGIFLSKFSIIQANQERQIELYDIITRQKGAQKIPNICLDEIKNSSDLINNLKRMTNSDNHAHFIQQHLKQMQKKEIQLNEIIRDQERQISQIKRELKNQNCNSYHKEPSQTIMDQKEYLQIIDRMELDHNEERHNDREIITNLRDKLDEFKINLKESQLENKEYELQLQKSNQEIDDLYEKFACRFRNKNDMQDSYENALKEQIENLRSGFLTQIAHQQELVRETNKIKQREIDDLKSQLKRESESKRLCLRKLEIVCPL